MTITKTAAKRMIWAKVFADLASHDLDGALESADPDGFIGTADDRAVFKAALDDVIDELWRKKR